MTFIGRQVVISVGRTEQFTILKTLLISDGHAGTVLCKCIHQKLSLHPENRSQHLLPGGISRGLVNVIHSVLSRPPGEQDQT